MPSVESHTLGRDIGHPRLAQARQVREVYKALLKQHGAQTWWPADGRFEIMAGAILTQNTAWTNVAKAIENLKAADMLHADAIHQAKQESLASLIRPSGYYNLKARRLKNYCAWYTEAGRYQKLRYWPTDRLRKALLSVHGVGPETADDILLYAFGRPVFVIDAYTRRIFARLGVIHGNEAYDAIRAVFERHLPRRAGVFAEYHALIVQHGKEICRPAPRCSHCELAAMCRFHQSLHQPV